MIGLAATSAGRVQLVGLRHEPGPEAIEYPGGDNAAYLVGVEFGIEGDV